MINNGDQMSTYTDIYGLSSVINVANNLIWLNNQIIENIIFLRFRDCFLFKRMNRNPYLPKTMIIYSTFPAVSQKNSQVWVMINIFPEGSLGNRIKLQLHSLTLKNQYSVILDWGTKLFHWSLTHFMVGRIDFKPESFLA